MWVFCENRTSYPAWASRMYSNFSLSSDEYGPDVGIQFPIGHYIEDYEFLGDIGLTLGNDFDLDEIIKYHIDKINNSFFRKGINDKLDLFKLKEFFNLS